MLDIDISSLTPVELDDLIHKASVQKAAIAKQHLDEVKKKLVQLAKDEGYSIEDLFGIASGGRTRRTAADVKYRNPANASETWAGRGKHPNWLRAAIATGADIESFRI